jgi:hypothetical protein
VGGGAPGLGYEARQGEAAASDRLDAQGCGRQRPVGVEVDDDSSDGRRGAIPPARPRVPQASAPRDGISDQAAQLGVGEGSGVAAPLNLKRVDADPRRAGRDHLQVVDPAGLGIGHGDRLERALLERVKDVGGGDFDCGT